MKTTVAGLLIFLAVTNVRAYGRFFSDDTEDLPPYLSEEVEELRAYVGEDVDSELQDTIPLMRSYDDPPQWYEYSVKDPFKKKECSENNIKETQCQPRPQEFDLGLLNNLNTARMHPNRVVVNRCQGQCQKCFPDKVVIKDFHVVRTDQEKKQHCGIVRVTEHLNCTCPKTEKLRLKKGKVKG